MRIFIATLAAALAMAPQAWAADAAGSPRAAQTGPLQPGRSAGVRQAQQAHTGLALVGGSAIIALIVVVAGTGGGGSSNSQANQQVAPATTT